MNRAEATRRINAILDEYFDEAPAPFIPGRSLVQYAGTCFGREEYKAAIESLLGGWMGLATAGHRLEDALARELGSAAGVVTNSGSSANLLAVAAMRSKNFRRPLQPGDEIIMPAMTFPTTVNPVLQHGLVPVLVDVEAGNYNLRVDLLEACLSDRTRGVMFAHTLGNPADMDTVVAFCRTHDLLLVEDCCDALGATWNGKPVGSFGDFATLSLYPSHHISMGEGGFVGAATADDVRILRSLRDWGRDCYCEGREGLLENGRCKQRFSNWLEGVDALMDHKYVYSEIGYNLKPLELQAAIGRVQVTRLPEIVAARRANFARLHAYFAAHEALFVLPSWSACAQPSWFSYPLMVREGAPFKRADIVRFLEGRHIQTRNLFAGNLLRQPAYRQINHRVVGDLRMSDRVLTDAFFLGVHPGMTAPMMDYVLSTLDEFLSRRPSTKSITLSGSAA